MHAGEVVAERFVIEREAGRGGMGTVYRALDRTTGEPVALKLLTSHEAVDAHRFEREARLLGAQEHPGIVRYVDHGATRKGEVYLAMEWLEGASLAELRGQHTLTIDDAVAIVRGAASALGAAHARGVV
ncbi:MAG: protein kinase, partial [Sandaracinaceae bacterium]|nr:protein kinase [Sandaracinaceae bacterium]